MQHLGLQYCDHLDYNTYLVMKQVLLISIAARASFGGHLTKAITIPGQLTDRH